ncbi:MAG: FAD-binding protein [Ruminococcaceae bacterium]|nr:FAD-binding protein [Oscillospiraceae bacterium]
MTTYDVVVVGGGPAGMAAAIAAYDAGCPRVVILDREPQPGGILMQCIHSGFGLHKLGRELTGPEYAAVYAQEVARRNIPVMTETTVTAITPDRVVTAQNRTGIVMLQAGAVILAMGCRERSRGALRICGTRPAGVYSAGTAQKLINCMGWRAGKRVVILGSGDIGLIMARRMSLEGAKVEAVCEVMPYSGGLTRNIVQCLGDFDIPLYLNTTVVEVHGQMRVEGVTIAQVDEQRRPIPETQRHIPCDTLLLSVGLIPENELTRSMGIPMDPVTGGALVDESCQTALPGIFACGNVLQVHDLVDYVSEEGERAGYGAAAFVQGKSTQSVPLLTQAGANVRYVLPQTISTTEASVSLFFRVTRPMGNVRCVARSGDTLLTSKTCPRVAPGEMERITLTPDMLQCAGHTITVTAEVTE